MHAFAGTTGTFFLPTFPTGLRLLAIQKFLSKILHVNTVLYVTELGCAQIKLLARVVCDFFFGQATGPYSANGAGF
jgi:hypothetical protein